MSDSKHRVGDKVMLRDPWIKRDAHVPPADVIDHDHHNVTLRFEDGVEETYPWIAVKYQ